MDSLGAHFKFAEMHLRLLKMISGEFQEKRMKELAAYQ
jgi:hypothetical protein